MKKNKGLGWLLTLVLCGGMGIFLAWVPIVFAMVHSCMAKTSFRETLRWEWQWYVREIEEAVE